VHAGDGGEAVAVSVIVATLGATAALATSLTVIAGEAANAGLPAEVILAVTPTRTHTTADVARVAIPLGIRVVESGERGKFRALARAVAVARGRHLVLVDADVRPQPGAFARLVRALEGGADVAVPRRSVAQLRNPGIVARILSNWAAQWADAWHMIRVVSDAHNWAVSGEMFAIRRAFFPEEVAVPLVDDASIGSAASARGARSVYVEDAVSEFVAPATFRDWFRQKVRTRRGIQRLRASEPRTYAMQAALRSAVMRSERHGFLSKCVVVGQERVVLLIAAVLDRFGPPPEHWAEIATTKEWHRTTSPVVEGAGAGAGSHETA
jgi:hypothetical protein